MVGPGPVQVRLAVTLNQTMTPIWNVIGRIPGAVEPDRVGTSTQLDFVILYR